VVGWGVGGGWWSNAGGGARTRPNDAVNASFGPHARMRVVHGVGMVRGGWWPNAGSWRSNDMVDASFGAVLAVTVGGGGGLEVVEHGWMVDGRW